MGPTQVKCPKLNIVTTKKVIFCFDLNKKRQMPNSRYDSSTRFSHEANPGPISGKDVTFG